MLSSIIFTWLPVIFLAHAAFSAFEHLARLKALDREDTLPASITIEALTSLAVFLVGVSVTRGPLKKISWESYMQTKTIDEVDAKSGFAVLDSRASYLFGDGGARRQPSST